MTFLLLAYFYGGQSLINEEELSKAEVVFSWNQKLFSLFGLDPLAFNHRLQLCVFVYSVVYFAQCCLNLRESFKEFDSMIDATTELGSMITVLLKLAIYRFKRHSLAELLLAVKTDYHVGRYRDEAEIRMFLDYVLKAKSFFKIAVSISINAAVLYYFRLFTNEGFSLPVKIGSDNLTTYVLPYSFKFFYPLTSRKAYLSAMLYIFPMVPISAFTIVADISLMIALLAHTCGQLSFLSRSVLRKLADSSLNFRPEIAAAVKQHERLIWLAKKINSTFSLIMLEQVLSISFMLCFVGYSLLVYWNQRNSAQLLTYSAPWLSMTFLLFAYCYVGQSLINESLYLSDALYESEWYRLAPSDLKYYVIVMSRARTPLLVTGSKFYVYSLNSFLVVMKSSMAYLSVLRTLI